MNIDLTPPPAIVQRMQQPASSSDLVALFQQDRNALRQVLASRLDGNSVVVALSDIR